MNHCEYFEELLSARLDDALTPEEQAELDAHLPTCPHCQAYAKDLQRLHETLLAMAADPPDWLLEDVMNRLGEPPRKKKKPAWGWLACAAALALVILAAVPPLFSGGISGGDAETAAAEEPAEGASAPAGGDTAPAEGTDPLPEEAGAAPPQSQENTTVTTNEGGRLEAQSASAEDLEGEATGEAAPAPLTLDREILTQEDAQEVLTDHLAAQGRGGLALTPAGLSGDGANWLFSAEESDGSPAALFSVSRETGEIQEMPAA